MYRADDYITKPFRIMEVIRRVEELLAKTSNPAAGSVPTNKTVEEAVQAAADALRQGRIDEALSSAQRAVQSDPFDARAHFVMGTTLHRVGRVYEAISEYERVVELAPTQFSALKNLAVMYERQGFRSKAAELWMRALNHSPSDAVRQTIKAHLIDLL